MFRVIYWLGLAGKRLQAIMRIKRATIYQWSMENDIFPFLFPVFFMQAFLFRGAFLVEEFVR